MKNLALLLLCITLITTATPVLAGNDYINLAPYPYSSHILGEDLVIKGETSFSFVTIGLYYPPDKNGRISSKFVLTISKKELKNGYVIPTDTVSKLWPEGIWTVVVQNGIRSELKINMVSTATADRKVVVASYKDNTLHQASTYPCRGVFFENNTLSLTLPDNTLVKVFSWNNLAPSQDGETRIYIATYTDGFMTNIKTYSGTLDTFGTHFTLNISPNEYIKLFYWNDNLSPVS